MRYPIYYRITSVAVAMAVTVAANAGRPTEDTEVVPFGSFAAYLQPTSIDQDPFNSDQGNFDDEWMMPDYGQPDLVYIDGSTLSWQAGQLPAAYNTINYFDDNGIAVNTTLETPESGDRYTTYFRVPFNVASGGGAGPWAMEYLADDGAAVYLDGLPVARLNCCTEEGEGVIDANKPAWFRTTANGTGTENRLSTALLDTTSLSNGDHVLAVSLHQVSTTSSDTGFDFRILKPGSARPWGPDASGDWADPANWTFGVADSSNEWAVFGDAYGAPHTIWNNASISVDGLQFENENTYNIGGTGEIKVSDGGINGLLGNHSVQVRVSLTNDIDAEIVDGASIDFNNRLNLNNRTLTKIGGGDLIVGNTANTGSGKIVLNEGGLAGSGAIAGDVDVAGGMLAPSGLVVPAGGAMTLTINGDANVNSGGITFVAYGDGNADAISGGETGTLQLGGIPVEIVLEPAYTPSEGDSFVAFPGWESIDGNLAAPSDWSFDAATGAFTYSSGGGGEAPCDLDGDADCDVDDINALTNRAGVTQEEIQTWLSQAGEENGFAGPLLNGDANLDGKIDAIDLNAVGQNWQSDGTMWSSGDFNGDDTTDALDLNAVGQNWQAAVPVAASSAAAVPEPGALSMLWVAGLTLLGACRTDKKRRRTDRKVLKS